MAESKPLAIPDFRAFWAARLAWVTGSTMMVIVIGWQVYDVARATMSVREAAFWLGMVGLAQFLPLFALTLVAGYVADRIDRKLIVRLALLLELGCAAVLAWLSWADTITLPALFVVAALLGVGRAFAGPALSSFVPNLVPPAMLPTAIAWSSIAWQTGAIGGPPLGGFLYAAADWSPYALSALLFALAIVAVGVIKPIPRGNAGESRPLQAVIEGLAYVRDNKIVLGAITLDLFAVLLGGATAMLPVFARDVLHVGSEGLGALRAAPALGAAVVAFALTRWPLQRRVGAKMFWCVALFGAATVVFGLSRELWLSIAALVVLGAADMVSVNVRSSLIQLHTPDSMRGRVSAVSGLFISASNELGEFRSGTLAAGVGAVESVVIGGVLAVIVTGICAVAFPSLRRADRFVVPSPKLLDEASNKSFVDDGPPAMVAGMDPKAEKGLR
jgi:MFS family permease